MKPELRELQNISRSLEVIARELKTLSAIAQKIEPKRATFELKRTVEGINSASFDVEYDHIDWDADANNHKHYAERYYAGGRAYGKTNLAREHAEAINRDIASAAREVARCILMDVLHIEEDDQQSYQQLEGWMR